jgi:hypothetical protein
MLLEVQIWSHVKYDSVQNTRNKRRGLWLRIPVWYFGGISLNLNRGTGRLVLLSCYSSVTPGESSGYLKEHVFNGFTQSFRANSEIV